MNHKWNYQPPSQEQTEAAKALAKETGISPILCKLLLERGITSAAEAKRFFRPQLNELHDPFLMKDMSIAVERLNQAMGRKERIMVYGDYDVDGTTAVALVYKFLQQFYSNIDYYIPDRYNEGYGVSVKGVDYACETGVKLIIVLDCGIKAVEEIAYAKEKGIDFIICDHHVPDDILPPAVAILNAKRADNTYPYDHLSGCGVGFKFMQAFALNNGIEFHDRITESVRAFIGEQAENTEGYDFAVQVFVTMTRDRGAVIDTVREGGIVVIIRNMSRHIGNDTGGDDDIQSDLHEGIADFVRF